MQIDMFENIIFYALWRISIKNFQYQIWCLANTLPWYRISAITQEITGSWTACSAAYWGLQRENNNRWDLYYNLDGLHLYTRATLNTISWNYGQMTLKVNVNSPPPPLFEYQSRESQDAQLVQIWWL